MNKALPVLLLLCSMMPCVAEQNLSIATVPKKEGACEDCHAKEAEEFRRGPMASAARTQDFLGEQSKAKQPDHCLKCHAPQGGEGVACVDCHGAGNHPYARVGVPQACSQCHDAPGENTVRSFRHLRSTVPGTDCIGCHTSSNKSFSHDFIGVSRRSFLEGVARLRSFLHREKDNAWHLTVLIRHRAGHALPGGTTGRSVWLRVTGRTRGGEIMWEKSRRFGWEYSPDSGWVDRSLPPGRTTRIQMSVPDAAGIYQIRAELVYRFKAGPLDTLDSNETELDSLNIHLAN